MNIKMKRRTFLNTLLAGAFSLACTQLGVRSGLLPSDDLPIIQNERRKAEREALRRSTWEGIFYDRKNRPLTIPTAVGQPSEVVDISVGNVIGYRTSTACDGLRKQCEEVLCYSSRKGGGQGTQIHLTLDLELQRKLYYDLVKGTNGCAIVYNCTTGGLLAAVSSRGETPYDVNRYCEKFDEFSKIPEFFYDPLYKKSVPGSTVKIIPAWGLLRSNIVTQNTLNAPVFYDTNEYHGIHNASPHYGETSLCDAVKKSLNTFFAWSAETIGINDYLDICSRFGFEDDQPMCRIEVDGHPLGATLGLTKDSPVEELRQTGFGQGKLNVTPYNIVLWYALLAASPDARLWMPHTVEYFHDPESDAKDWGPEYEQCLPRAFFDDELQEALRIPFAQAAESYGLSHPDVTGIWGKSGTAETSTKGSNNIYLVFSFTTAHGGAYSALICQNGVDGTSSLLKPKAKQMLNDIMEVISC